MNIYSLDHFKQCVKSGEKLPENAVVRQEIAVVEKAIDDTRYIADFIASTDSIDRHQDRVMASGWMFDHFMKNPVFAWNHDYSIPPIGRVLSITQDPGQIKTKVQFDEADPFARKLFAKLVGGFMGSCSVGFIPLTWKWAEDQEARPLGMDILTAELIEISLVSVPANPQALIIRRSLSDPEPAPDPAIPLPSFIPGSRKRADRFRLLSYLPRRTA